MLSYKKCIKINYYFFFSFLFSFSSYSQWPLRCIVCVFCVVYDACEATTSQCVFVRIGIIINLFMDFLYGFVFVCVLLSSVFFSLFH